MLVDGLVAALGGHRRAVQGAVVLGRMAHVIGHHVDEVQIGDGLLEVHVLRVRGRCHGQEPVVSERFPEILHQQGEVLGVLGGGGDARRTASGVLPVDVDAVQAVLGHGVEAVPGERLPVLPVRGHLAEVAGAPAADGQEHFQVRVLLLEGDHELQPAFLLDVQRFEVVVDQGESVVEMRQESRVREGVLPIHRIAHDDRFGGRCRRGGRVIGTAVVAPVPVVPVVAPVMARGLFGDRDDNSLGGLVAGEQQRQGDKEEGDQSFHGGILFRLSQM